MSDIFENAINSIKCGLEDYQSNDDRRPVSAIRNFYAGVLLLGKECLIYSVPKGEPMDILALKFVPVPDGNGGVVYEPKGYRTIDLEELKQRFKTFDIEWPSGNINRLQKLRNNFEHYHSPSPKDAIQQAIAECFPLVQGFFEILRRNPAEALGETWDVMLAEKEFFTKQKTECDASFDSIPWGNSLSHLDRLSCSACSSSLIYQVDQENADPASIEGKCIACAKEFSAELTVKMIVEAEHGIADYFAEKDVGDRVIYDCPECSMRTYVFGGETNECYFCHVSLGGECDICSEDLTVVNQSIFDTSRCDYCYYRMEKLMRE